MENFPLLEVHITLFLWFSNFLEAIEFAARFINIKKCSSNDDLDSSATLRTIAACLTLDALPCKFCDSLKITVGQEYPLVGHRSTV